MKWFSIIAMTLLMTMTGCKNEKETQYRGCFENDDAVSLKDVIDIYDKYASAKEDSTDFDLFAAFYGQDAADSVLKLEIVGDTAFALQLPEYASSGQLQDCHSPCPHTFLATDDSNSSNNLKP